MTVNDVILEAAKRFGIDTSPGLVSAVCCFNFVNIKFLSTLTLHLNAECCLKMVSFLEQAIL